MPDTPSRNAPAPNPAIPDPAKAALRVTARARRRAAHAAFGPRMGPVLTANFMAAFSLPPRVAVAGYSPIGEEADVAPLMTALGQRGHPLCLPVVVIRDAPLAFRAWTPGAALVPGPMGIGEPPADAPALRPDVMLVPLLAFDGVGHRLGYGGGYYDRTLAALRAGGPLLAVGIAYSAQEVDRLPGNDHDQRLDAVLTELGIVRFAREGLSSSRETR